MKVINIILSILILLLAAAAATFSYFLFEKRSQFVTGWAKMADTINKSAVELDKGSGTKLAAKLSASAMTHEKYADLDGLLPELPKLSRQVILERDNLADALRRISSVIRMKNVVAKDSLCNLNTYSSAKDDVVRGVSDVISRRDRTYRNLISAANAGIRVRIDNNLLLAGDAKAFTAFRNELNKIRARSVHYENELNALARMVNAPRVNSSEKAYRASTAKIKSALTAYQRRANQTARELNKSRQTVRSRDRQIVSLNNRIKGLNNTVADRNAQIVSFQRAFGLPDSTSDAKPWLPGSKEARAKVAGKVIAVHNDYGYIAIDIGQYTVVQQVIGNRTLEVNPKLEAGMAMIVTRGTGDKKEFITRLSLTEVGESSSIANIPVDSKQIRVGDVVVVAEEVKAKAPAAPAKSVKAAKR